MPNAWEGRGGYSGYEYPINPTELAAGALAEMAATKVVDLTKSLYPTSLFNALPKGTAPADVLRWTAVLQGGAATDLAVNASVAGVTRLTSANSRLALTEVGFQRKVVSVIQVNNNELQLGNAMAIAGIDSLYSQRVGAAVRLILEAVQNDLYTGAGSTTGVTGLQSYFTATSHGGLPHTLADYTGKVAGVDYFPTWRPLSAVFDISDKTLVFNDGHGTGGTEVVATSKTLASADMGLVFDHYLLTLREKQRRFNVIVANPSTIQSIVDDYRLASNLGITVQNGDIVRTELGAGSPSYNGVPFVGDVKCPANTYFFLNIPEIVLLTFPYTSAPGAAVGSSSQSAAGLNLAVGPLYSENTIDTQTWEVNTKPHLWVQDTAALNRLVVQA